MHRKGRKLHKALDSLRSLKSEFSVAMKLIELSKDIECKIGEYVQVIELSDSFTMRLLTLANSSWFSPRQPITMIKLVLTMIGVRHVRALAMSHCLEATHKGLGIDDHDATAYWGRRSSAPPSPDDSLR